jgi:hypothetical protein
MSEEQKKRGFAALSPERMKQIASSGGMARKVAYDQSHQQKPLKKNEEATNPPKAN